MKIDEMFEYLGIDLRPVIGAAVERTIEEVVVTEINRSAALRQIIRNSMIEYVNSKKFLNGMMRKVKKEAASQAKGIMPKRKKRGQH